ncbi:MULTISPECIES: MFS transporter [unclassified Pseudodesulfovibrio]|uniref:MFS transporter n=1 Tax=unclassified Pseudodesulfovibrio TaxID=2661612 RepID=UPI0013E2936B|nr:MULTISPECIES: MFS transporter [unclassified Pseudodesulfovibrio]MCJ2163530.1 MFS transporter [Pseudodesulfovibrio sp. S3-i]
MNIRLHGPGFGSAHKMFLLATMYFCQAIPMGYVFGSLPVIMRENDVSLAHIGWIFVLHFPWALKFLYASWVDHHYIPALGRRRSWIFPLQWVAAILLLVAAHTPPDSAFIAMFLVMTVLNTVLATNDIAVDGYASDILLEHERPWGNTIQAGARYVGLFLGGGLMLALHSSLGWESLCIALSATVFLLSLPVFLHKEILPVYRKCANPKEQPAGVRIFLRRREVRWLLPVLIAPTAFAFSSFMMRTPLFVDLGLDSSAMGRLMMHYAVPFGVAGTIATAWFLNRFGSRLYLRFFCVGTILLAVYAVYLSRVGTITILEAGIVLSMDNILMGGINVWGYTLMMRACVGRNSGTGFAVLSSLFILVPLVTAPLTGKLGDVCGFTLLYSLLTGLIVFGFIIAEMALRLSRDTEQRNISSEAAVRSSSN